jgi:hypothetical protein
MANRKKKPPKRQLSLSLYFKLTEPFQGMHSDILAYNR